MQMCFLRNWARKRNQAYIQDFYRVDFVFQEPFLLFQVQLTSLREKFVLRPLKTFFNKPGMEKEVVPKLENK